jgi:hypothetical protein
VSDDKIISFEPKRKTRAADNADQQLRAKRSVERVRILSRAVRELRESGANTKEIARTLRMIADELEGGGVAPA